MPSSPNVTVLGAGALGAAMATRLGETGHQVRLWNRTPGRAREAAARATGVTAVDTLDEAVSGASVVVTVLHVRRRGGRGDGGTPSVPWRKGPSGCRPAPSDPGAPAIWPTWPASTASPSSTPRCRGAPPPPCREPCLAGRRGRRRARPGPAGSGGPGLLGPARGDRRRGQLAQTGRQRMDGRGDGRHERRPRPVRRAGHRPRLYSSTRSRPVPWPCRTPWQSCD